MNQNITFDLAKNLQEQFDKNSQHYKGNPIIIPKNLYDYLNDVVFSFLSKLTVNFQVFELFELGNLKVLEIKANYTGEMKFNTNVSYDKNDCVCDDESYGSFNIITMENLTLSFNIECETVINKHNLLKHPNPQEVLDKLEMVFNHLQQNIEHITIYCPTTQTVIQDANVNQLHNIQLYLHFNKDNQKLTIKMSNIKK